ncbi:MAG: filamentous hemagglutinin, partial [Symploca sp. SIO3E6]|nr:filamentous hemagglutinin [Caldora sp. SIO3E6]
MDGETSNGLSGGIFSQVNSEAKGNSGGIELTTPSLEVTNGAIVSASTFGVGDSGAVKITATDLVHLDGETSNGFSSGVYSQVNSEAKGDSGGIELTTSTLEVASGAAVSASTGGEGDAGTVRIIANDLVRLDGETSNGASSSITSQVLSGAEGNSKGIELTTSTLELTNGAAVSASTGGEGDAGTVRITANDSVRLDGETSNGASSSITSQVFSGAEGNSEGIELTTSTLELTNGATVNTSTLGVGDSGTVRIIANDSVRLDGETSNGASSSITSQVLSGAEGNSKGIELTTSTLELTNGATVNASTLGVGDSGAVRITANDSVRLDGETSNGASSSITSQVLSGAEGNSKGIELTTSSLELTNGATVNTSTLGVGDSGTVRIIANDSVRLDGETSNGASSSITS